MKKKWQKSKGMSTVQVKEIADGFLVHVEKMIGYDDPDKEGQLERIRLLVSAARYELSTV